MRYINPIKECTTCLHVHAKIKTSKMSNKTRWVFNCGNNKIKNPKIECEHYKEDPKYKLKPYYNEYGF